MHVAIVGAGFGGLAAAYRLVRSGIDVTILESEDRPGGLAVGFKEKEWKWSLERHYHHWFTNDDSVLNLANEIGHKVITVRPKTSTFYNGKIYQLDSPISLLLFNELTFFDRIRTGLVLAYLKSTRNWKSLEALTSKEFLMKYMGEKSWEILWEPLFTKKFNNFSDDIPASWFWARIKKRTPSLAYPEGGFLSFALTLDNAVRKNGGRIYYGTKIENIVRNKGKLLLKTSKSTFEYDRIICTFPSPIFAKVIDGLPQKYIDNLLDLKGIGAVNLVLSLKKQFLEDGTYWLNINANHFPFLAVVEHTNFMDKKYYNNERLLYVGNYLPQEHAYYQKNAGELLREFYPFLKTINPKFDKSWINRGYVFKAPFAQPIIPLSYSQKVPKFETPIRGLYLCNIQQVYPWDRGTNYAVENGEKLARLVLKSVL